MASDDTMQSGVDEVSFMGGRVAESALLEDRLRFETLIADLSSRFINLPADAVDHEIETAQRRVCQCLGLNVSGLWQWSPEDPGIFTLTHLYRPLGGPPLPERMEAHEHFPWSMRQALAGKIVAISSLP